MGGYLFCASPPAGMPMPSNVLPINQQVQPHAANPLLPIRCNAVKLSLSEKRVLNGLSFSIADAGITVIMGPNGAGKSVTLRVLAGLIQPNTGEVMYGEQTVSTARLDTGFVFQRPVLLRRSVSDNLLHALKLAGIVGRTGKARMNELLELGGLKELAKSPARRLSGGEQQRLALVRALASSPKVLLLDEPSASLDPRATFHIENIIRDVSQSGVKVVVITHDQAQALRIADEVVFISQGQCSEVTPAKQFFQKPQSREAAAYLSGQLFFD